MPEIKLDTLAKSAKDALYVTVGLGVIAVQKAQVQRQELNKRLKSQADEAKGSLQHVRVVLYCPGVDQQDPVDPEQAQLLRDAVQRTRREHDPVRQTDVYERLRHRSLLRGSGACAAR